MSELYADDRPMCVRKVHDALERRYLTVRPESLNHKKIRQLEAIMLWL